MTTKDISELAYEAGKSGVSWLEFTGSDAVQTLVDAIDHDGHQTADIVSTLHDRYHVGKREHREASGWVKKWTTAPADYDWFGTETISEGGDLHYGKAVRRVLMDPHHAQAQIDRYCSGLCGAWEEDPRVTEKNTRAQIDRERAEAEERANIRAAWLEVIKTVSDEELQGLIDDGDTDSRAERTRRDNVIAEAHRAEAWALARALVPDGCVLIEDAFPGTIVRPEHGQSYRIPPCDYKVHYDIRVISNCDDPEASNVYTSKGSLMTLAYLAERITKPDQYYRLRVAKITDVPPEPVLNRIGHDQLAQIKRVEVAGKTVWVGRPRFSHTWMIVDERGRLVRARAVVAAALLAVGL